MKDSKEILHSYVSEMIGAERHIVGAIDSQLKDDRVVKFVEAREILERVSHVLHSHLGVLEAVLDRSGKERAAKLKQAATALTGAAAGLYDKIRRSDPASRNLRDDYTALNLAAVSYSMLHTTALAHKDQEIADLALRHLRDLTPLIMDLSGVIPLVVAMELVIEDKSIDASVGAEAARNTSMAWRPGQEVELEEVELEEKEVF
jgi:ferritin-like metal-binding protein YciE